MANRNASALPFCEPATARRLFKTEHYKRATVFWSPNPRHHKGERQPPEVDHRASTVPLLELQGVQRLFDETSGIRDVNLRVNRGDFLAIVGPSGAGKSTLLNIIGLLDRPDSGSYRLNGVDIAHASERERDRYRSRNFGFVFQSSFALGDENCRRNAELGLKIQGVALPDRSGIVESTLNWFGLGDRSLLLARDLSGGEKQRLGIARAVATRPEILLADEPTGNLDSHNTQIVLDSLDALNDQGVTLIIVTHDDEVSARAKRVIRVIDGQLSESPSPRRDPSEHATVPSDEHTPLSAIVPSRSVRLETWIGRIFDRIDDVTTSLTHRMMRSTLLTLAFALGVGGLVAAVGVSQTTSEQVTQRLSVAALDEVRVTPAGGGALLKPDNPQLDQWANRIKELPGVQNVGFTATIGASSAQVRRFSPTDPEPNANLLVSSVSSEYLRLQGVTQLPSAISLLDATAATDIAFLGKNIAKALDVSVGDGSQTIWVLGRRLTVVGIISGAPGRIEGLHNTVFVSRNVLAGEEKLDVSLVVRTEFGFPAAVAEAIPLRLDPVQPARFTTETVADLRNLRFGVTSDLGILLAALAGIVLIITAIGASTTMMLSVQSRKSEIAFRRAVGQSRFGVSSLFLLEGVIIGALGGAFGAAFGVMTILGLSLSRGWEPTLTPVLPPIAILIGVITGLASAALPAWRASRAEPAAAIRG
ncbi:MAG: hypothetical protein B5766_07330 [Candidatus Lumbricidophila eiseniae]|uniref:ABC transporter domain-containing protein n=1 Tax=Candidatus Lumbricidiphila eiseniae TaxID=1969409 RepID=A0A2A6FR96_9MICO|nr:MAG: hypothetical protein B5766_07330 [Candidatus Lumbricidophila eiseniae]